MDDASPKRPPAGADDFIAAALRLPGFLVPGGPTPAARSFLKQIRDHASPDELAELGPAGPALVAEFWAWSARKLADDQWVRLRTIGDRDLLEIVGPDMPFLIRSVTGEIAERGIEVKALFHPIVMVARDGAGARLNDGPARPESYIQIHLEKLGPARGEALLEGVKRTLRDLRLAVGDYAALKKKMSDVSAALEKAKTGAPPDEAAEAVAFLRWLEDDSFTFRGARDYDFHRTADGDFAVEEPIVLPETGIGLLRDPDRYVLRRSDEPSLLTPELKYFIDEPSPLIVSKSNFRSLVHRRVTADYIGVKRYNAEGQVVGETRFVGLFTADAYNRVVEDIPLLRRKAARVLAASGAKPGTHNYSVLRNILETYPRDEMFQIGELELLDTAIGVLHLSDRPRARLFIRRDRFNRFIAALAYVPKDRFNSTLREGIGRLLTSAYGGEVDAFFPTLGDGRLARIYFLVDGIDRNRPEPDIDTLNAKVAALARTWDDRFVEAARADKGRSDEQRETAATRFAGAFTAGYRERYEPAEALIDIAEIEKTGDGVRVRAYRLAGDGAERLRCKIYSRGAPLALSAVMPVLENMGLFVLSEDDLKVSPAGEDTTEYWIHDLDMRAADGAPLDFEKVEMSFEAAFAAAWEGRAENDGFNRLILKLGVSWREAALIRALARYRTQTGLDPSQIVQEQALAAHPDITRQILGLFRVRFDPSLPEDVSARRSWAENLRQQIDTALGAVSSLDEDRVLRRIARLVDAIQRTNFYQPAADSGPKDYISFKVASPALEDLPLPKPYREIFVWSPQVEGVHLRFGPIARGGLRWSDRRDDFRVETLSLAKAQQVKNAIIVPVGAKGGFFPKKLPRGGTPAETRAAAVAAYKTFLRGLLDLTDDIVDGAIVPPPHVVRWDDDDPYLVVAADKGTATFSDFANSISAEYEFWLGDAFASGGSAGYDHKAMGITAKGAWEAVKRHFREMGVDIQTAPFDVIGVGDMSGDVFGNGMLLSKKIRLRAAFDHRDIFIDPDPADLDAAWAERKRLFELPGSSWKNYDAKLISAGGGVYSRSAKSIPVSAELRAMTGLAKEQVTPAELVSALLAAPCDLLWFGGIGTFIKAANESNADVGDKANDLSRINAEQLRAKVIGEGANLGVTQAARIVFARAGGRINSDAIDNSAGVDTSDHEVNIKILLFDAARSQALAAGDRGKLLTDMTGDVATHVLSHNYNQTLALSLAESAARADLDACERLIQRLESQGKLNREVEGLPATEGFAELRQRGLGLTRPELAKLIAYAKLDLSAALVASDAPDDRYFEQTLTDYFPPQLQAFKIQMDRHRLRRDIIATTLADDMVNIAGATFIDRVRDAAQTDAASAAIAFAAARAVHETDALAARINALDNKIPAAAQIGLHQDIAAALRRATIALSRRLLRERIGAADLIARYTPAASAQRGALWQSLSDIERGYTDAQIAAHVDAGAPADLAQDVVALAPMTSAFDIADLARTRDWPAAPAALAYRAIGAAFSLDALRVGAASLTLSQHWERLALRRLMTELNDDQRALAAMAIKGVGLPADRAAADAIVARWISALGETAKPTLNAIADMQASGAWSFAKIVLAAAALRALAMGL